MLKLNPCKECGQEPAGWHASDKSPILYTASCCGVTTGFHYDPGKIAEEWNAMNPQRCAGLESCAEYGIVFSGEKLVPVCTYHGGKEILFIDGLPIKVQECVDEDRRRHEDWLKENYG